MRSDLALRTLGLVTLLALSAACNGSDDPAVPGGGSNPPPIPSGTLKADHACADAFATVPMDAIASAGGLRLYYGHTSHGSQLVTGLAMIAAADAAYARPAIHEVGRDLGTLGDLAWATTTRAWLADHADETDVVLWSWCGGVSANTPAGIDAYLQAMTQLEADYPSITFIYMTGHLDGTGPGGTLHANNERIRAYCAAHSKWLFDFADIESWAPDGTSYPDESDACSWCEDWCASHDCPDCSSCAHSHCFNCWRKGQAFWWLLARVGGWEG